MLSLPYNVLHLMLAISVLLVGCTNQDNRKNDDERPTELPKITVEIDEDRPIFRSGPNILLIITDDQRYDTIDYMPETKARIFDQGVVFNSAYITTPNCCPSRSSILTGLYTSHHNVWHNGFRLEKTTFVEALQEQGYFTGVVGKYLNSYPLQSGDSPLAEFDFWVAHGSMSGGGYNNFELFVQDEVMRSEKYLTYVERDYALNFLEQAHKQSERPFFLLFAPHAPHTPATPAPEDKNLYEDLAPYRPASFNEADISDKPGWLQEQKPLLTEENIATMDEYRLDQLRSLRAADQAVAAILNTLEEQGEIDNTLIIFLSDNGEQWGEHRLDGKNTPYEPSIHVPFAIRYPALVTAGGSNDHLVANIDIAPTIYDLLNLDPPYALDGLSLLPLLTGEPVAWRDNILIESWSPTRELMWSAIHTGDAIYIENRYLDGMVDLEFYDLALDPEELENGINDPQFSDLIEELSAHLPLPRPDWPTGPASKDE
jgi:N-acetylglucosamine-6-sulfatase